MDVSSDNNQNLNLTVSTDDDRDFPELPNFTLSEKLNGLLSAHPTSPVNASCSVTTPKGFSWKIIDPLELFDPRAEEEQETIAVTFRVPDDLRRELSSGDQKTPEEFVPTQAQSEEAQKAKEKDKKSQKFTFG